MVAGVPVVVKTKRVRPPARLAVVGWAPVHAPVPVRVLRVVQVFRYDYLTKPVVRDDLLAAVQVRLARAQAVRDKLEAAAAQSGFNPDYSSADPLQKAFALTAREAEVLLWVAQGKSNGDIGIILGMSEKTAKQHLGSVFQKMGVEGRNAAALQAVEILSRRRL